MSHQSGIKDFTASFDYRGAISRLPSDKDEFIKKYCSGDLAHEPGSIYSYCNAGYVILGRIIDKVTLKTFEQLIKDGRVDDGLRLMELDIELTPGKVWMLRRTAEAYLSNGHQRKALIILNKGLELKPDDDRLKAMKAEADQDLKGK